MWSTHRDLRGFNRLSLYGMRATNSSSCPGGRGRGGEGGRGRGGGGERGEWRAGGGGMEKRRGCHAVSSLE